MKRLTGTNTDAVDSTAPLLDHAKKSMDDEREKQRQTTETPLGGLRAKLIAILNLLFVTLPILIFVDGLRLFLFVMFLAPAFAQFAWYYFVTSHRIVKCYSPHSCRTTLDIYGAQASKTVTTNAKKPVLLLFPGGAWLIGYKMWGALLAKAMASHYLVVICDYRNYSIVGGGATVPTMVQDVHDAIVWTFSNCETYGGDSRKIILVGQSAGGHLCACVLLRKVLEQLQRRRQQQVVTDDQQLSEAANASTQPSLLETSSPTLGIERNDFDPTDLAGFVSLSSPFNLQVMKDTLARHGLGGYCDQGLIDRMFGFKMKDYDPQVLLTQCCDLVQQEQQGSEQAQEQQHHLFVSHYLPPVAIFHGTNDKTVPFQGSRMFYRTLVQLPQLDDGDEEEQPPHSLPLSSSTKSSTELHLYTGWSHTDPILEGLFDGDHRFHVDLNRLVKQWIAKTATTPHGEANCNGNLEASQESEEELRKTLTDDDLDTTLRQHGRVCPHFLIAAARWVNPF